MDCPVCMVSYTVKTRAPIVLPCGHTICLTCVSNQNVNACPICRKSIQDFKAKYGPVQRSGNFFGRMIVRPPNQTENYPRNYDLQNLLSIYNQLYCKECDKYISAHQSSNSEPTTQPTSASDQLNETFDPSFSNLSIDLGYSDISKAGETRPISKIDPLHKNHHICLASERIRTMENNITLVDKGLNKMGKKLVLKKLTEDQRRAELEKPGSVVSETEKPNYESWSLAKFFYTNPELVLKLKSPIEVKNTADLSILKVKNFAETLKKQIDLYAAQFEDQTNEKVKTYEKAHKLLSPNINNIRGLYQAKEATLMMSKKMRSKKVDDFDLEALNAQHQEYLVLMAEYTALKDDIKALPEDLQFPLFDSQENSSFFFQKLDSFLNQPNVRNFDEASLRRVNLTRNIVERAKREVSSQNVKKELNISRSDVSRSQSRSPRRRRSPSLSVERSDVSNSDSPEKRSLSCSKSEKSLLQEVEERENEPSKREEEMNLNTRVHRLKSDSSSSSYVDFKTRRRRKREAAKAAQKKKDEDAFDRSVDIEAENEVVDEDYGINLNDYSRECYSKGNNFQPYESNKSVLSPQNGTLLLNNIEENEDENIHFKNSSGNWGSYSHTLPKPKTPFENDTDQSQDQINYTSYKEEEEERPTAMSYKPPPLSLPKRAPSKSSHSSQSSSSSSSPSPKPQKPPKSPKSPKPPKSQRSPKSQKSEKSSLSERSNNVSERSIGRLKSPLREPIEDEAMDDSMVWGKDLSFLN